MSIRYPKLNFPSISLNLRKDKNNFVFFDYFRKKTVRLTPEEWVRQHVAYYLLSLGYPATSLALEKEFLLVNKAFRADLILYDGHFQPLLLVECKAAQQKLSEKDIEQLLNYNFVLHIPFLFLTNGLQVQMLAWNTNENRYEKTEDIAQILRFWNTKNET